MAYSDKQWDVVRAFYERGLSLGEITLRPEVDIKDRGVISKKAKQAGWIKGIKATLVDKEIYAKQSVAEIAEEKATLNTTDRIVHDTLVDERTKHLAFFTNAAVKNVQQAMRTTCEDQADLRMRADTILKGKETVIGKQPDTAIQINNNAPQITPDRYAEIAKAALDDY